MTDLTALLEEFYRDKSRALAQHQDGARLVTQYDANNTYQYIINRDEAQLSWVASAIADSGGQLPEVGAARGTVVDDRTKASRAIAAHAVIEEDAREAQAFVDRWRPRVEAMTHARHANMLRVVLGEVLEQKRFFEQALAGRTDLLGRRADVLEPARGEVLPTRWIE